MKLESLPPPQFPQNFAARRFEALFPHVGIVGCAVYLTPQLLLWFICTEMWDHQVCSLCLTHPVLQPRPCYVFSPSWLPVSGPPTNLNECFLFNSLVVRLPHSLIFWQFWVFCFFLICCCPSFGCVRKQSVSIYAPILAGSGKKSVLNLRTFEKINGNKAELYENWYLEISL